MCINSFYFTHHSLGLNCNQNTHETAKENQIRAEGHYVAKVDVDLIETELETSYQPSEHPVEKAQSAKTRLNPFTHPPPLAQHPGQV